MAYDRLDRLDASPGGRSLRALFKAWTMNETLSPLEGLRLANARRDPDFFALLGTPAEQPASPPPPPGTPPPGSNLTFDASKLSDAEFHAWRQREGI